MIGHAEDARASVGRVVAVLGPTNTGKTHLAMERMLGHASGVIGFPLRLLARENYERAVAIKGPAQVALITGEEKIIPPHARWFICTVESMPLSRDVAFLAVDEIQMCADPDRGHIFTDRLLHARGREETMFLGAETIRPLIRRLVPRVEFLARPRFSRLVWAGAAKLSRLPRRSAVVAFSVADVYAIAELVRRQRGGAAIVLGALSPRTRNAQVAMYQAGEVDYLVATDAIGMGLNMSVDHVAFAATRKFDGRRPRALTAAELAQIAGRAGRYTRDGTFGVTGDAPALDADAVARIEGHTFEPLETLFWRASELSFTSVAALRASLARIPRRPGLTRAREADDELALAHLAADAEIMARAAASPERVRLLWEVAQIPDFGKVMSDGHARLLGHVYRHLTADGAGRIPTDWIARQVDRLNRADGDIEALMLRIAGVRTWTYVAHRGDWLASAEHWRERTRALEDKLSDALHERLMQRFVDRRAASLALRLRDRDELEGVVAASGEVLVEGHCIGAITGFRYELDASVTESGRRAAPASRAVLAAAMRALRAEARRRAARIEADDDARFALDDEGVLRWRDEPVATLARDDDPLRPQVAPFPSPLLAPELRDRVRRRLAAWLEGELARRLGSVSRAREAELPGAARGLVHQIAERLGSAPRRAVEAAVAALGGADRAALRAVGLRIGRESVFFPDALKPKAMRARALLWATHRGLAPRLAPAAGVVSFAAADDDDFLEAIGFRTLRRRAIRVDMLERLADAAHRMARASEPFSPPRELAAIVACPPGELAGLLEELGFVVEAGDAGPLVRRPRQARRRPRAAPHLERAARREAASPFAALRALTPRR